MQYRSKDIVEAIQYTGENEEEVIAFIKEKDTEYRGWKIEKRWDKGITYSANEPFFHQLAVYIGDYVVKTKIIVTKYADDFEKRFVEATPFPKEAYELVDDFVCTMMNRSPAISQEVIDELIPHVEHDKGDGEAIIKHKKILGFLDALETIKKALGIK